MTIISDSCFKERRRRPKRSTRTYIPSYPGPTEEVRKKSKEMKRAILFLLSTLLICSLAACSFRSKGQAYPDYPCRESFMHFYSRCAEMGKAQLDEEVKKCRNDLSSQICDQELADLLWCMGRAEPGLYSRGGASCTTGACLGNSSITDGCDCSFYTEALKECRMKKGIF